MVCEVDEAQTGLSRDLLSRVLEAERVLAKRYFYPGCHQAAPYLSEHLRRNTPLPVTEQLAQTVVVLPTGANVDVLEIDRVCSLIQYIVDSSLHILEEVERRANRYYFPSQTDGWHRLMRLDRPGRRHGRNRRIGGKVLRKRRD